MAQNRTEPSIVASFYKERKDDIYVVVTIGARANKYRVITRKPKLHQNEFAYKLHITVNLNEWEERIKEVAMIPPRPPEIPDFKVETEIALSTPVQVMNRLKGK